MKLSNIENAKKAHKMLKNLDVNIKKLKEKMQKELLSDFGGIEGVFEYGYSCYVGEHSDNSGFSVNLSGCYVGYQVNAAVLKVIEEQRDNVLAYLKSINVEVDEKNGY